MGPGLASQTGMTLLAQRGRVSIATFDAIDLPDWARISAELHPRPEALGEGAVEVVVEGAGGSGGYLA